MDAAPLAVMARLTSAITDTPGTRSASASDEVRGEIEAAIREFERSLDEGLGETSSLFHLTTLRKRLDEVRQMERHVEHINE